MCVCVCGGGGGGDQHTSFGHGGHIYPTQTKDKKVLLYKALYGESLFLSCSWSPQQQSAMPPPLPKSQGYI